MRRAAALLGLVPAVVTACATTPAPAPSAIPHAPTAPIAAPAPAPAPTSACATPRGVQELLARHARAYGSEAQLDASLPRTLAGKLVAGGAEGDFELTLDPTGYRWASQVGGLFGARGVDAVGPWELGVGGAALRLRDVETVPVAFESWLWRRRYVSAFDPVRDEARCEDVDGAPRVSVQYNLASLGHPELVFDAATAALLSGAQNADGTGTVHSTFDAWSPPDRAGVRWPAELRAPRRGPMGETVRVSTNEAGLRCASRGAGWPAASDCLAPFAPSVTVTWPDGGIVRVPLVRQRDEILLRVATKGPAAWALLDSGAETTVIDTSSRAITGFHPGLSTSVIGPGEALGGQRLGLLDSLSVGGLTLTRVPAIGMSGDALEVLDADGDRRPAAVIGLGLFLAAAIRVDYAKQELVLAKTAETLHGPSAIPLEVRILGDRVIAPALVGGAKAFVQLDTGSDAGFTLSRAWGAEHGIPGDRPAIELRASVGVGPSESRLTVVRIDRAQLGPVSFDDRSIALLDSPVFQGAIAGAAGEPVFARCAAVTWDLAQRTLWFEPPCDRPSIEHLAGWGLRKSADARQRDRPWVVRYVVDRSAAAKAGLKAGDRLLDVGGMPATSALQFERAIERPVGTKVPVTVDRDGQRLRVVLELVRFP